MSWRGDTEEYVNAADIAREHRLNEKSFRARLRRNLPDDHTPGSWRVGVGSAKHGRMVGEAKAMAARDVPFVVATRYSDRLITGLYATVGRLTEPDDLDDLTPALATLCCARGSE